MTNINNAWDSSKRAETPYFHCGPPGQNEDKRIGQMRKQKNNNKTTTTTT